MPCVFPVIGLKIMGFVTQAGEDRRTIILHGLVYTLGVLVSFWILATILILLRQVGKNWVGAFNYKTHVLFLDLLLCYSFLP